MVMRQHHRAGEKLFVDYSGQTVAVVNQATGEIRQAEIFVATLGASIEVLGLQKYLLAFFELLEGSEVNQGT